MANRRGGRRGPLSAAHKAAISASLRARSGRASAGAKKNRTSTWSNGPGRPKMTTFFGQGGKFGSYNLVEKNKKTRSRIAKTSRRAARKK